VFFMKKLGMSFTVLFIILSMMLANVICASAAVVINDTFDGGTYATNGYKTVASYGRSGLDIINQKLRITAENVSGGSTAKYAKDIASVNSGTLTLTFDYIGTGNHPGNTSTGTDWVSFSNGTTNVFKVNVKGTTAANITYTVGTGSATAMVGTTAVFLANTNIRFKFVLDFTNSTVDIYRSTNGGVSYTSWFSGTGISLTAINKIGFATYGSAGATIDYDNINLSNDANPIFNDTFDSGSIYTNGYYLDNMMSSTVYNGNMIIANKVSTASSSYLDRVLTENIATGGANTGKLVVEYDVSYYNDSVAGTRTYPYTDMVGFYNTAATPAKIISLYNSASSNNSNGIRINSNTGTYISTNSTANFWTDTSPITIRLVVDRAASKLDVYKKVSGVFNLVNTANLTFTANTISRVRFFGTYGTNVRTEFDNIKIYTIDGVTQIPSPIIVNDNGSALTNTFATGSVVRAAVPVFNNDATQKDLTIVLALYDSSNKLKNITYTSPQTIAASETANLFDLKYTLPAVATGDYIKAFAWDTIDTIKPLAASTTSVTKQ
jgi:hypothetical protein